MARVLTGIQATGTPHLGNVLGAILPGIRMAQEPGNEAYLFIANLHSFTAIKNADVVRENTYSVAAAWLACGLDPAQTVFYRQSDVTEVTELMWYLNCVTPFPMLANAHSFKDKSANLAEVNAGLFTYPVLMAADILLYDADIVPVGKDQRQHLEMARDIAGAFNHRFGELLVLPEGRYEKSVMIVPGTDGRKMSKSYGNVVNIFADDKTLKKQVMGIVTDSTPLEAPKDPDNCNVFALYKLVATPELTAQMRKKYEAGGYGYGHAKKDLLELLMEHFAKPRKLYETYMADRGELDKILADGADRARQTASSVLHRVRNGLKL
ncbi:MAG: tryptophan--tRNA ligase [Salibacteraceae bacterium]